MGVEQAINRLLALLDEHSGRLTAAVIEADPDLDTNRDVASAAARVLASMPDITTAEETDTRTWFPYSLLSRSHHD